MTEKNTSTSPQYWLDKSNNCNREGSLVQALKNIEHAIFIEPNSVEARRLHIGLITTKSEQFDVSNKNHENALRELVDAWGGLIDIDESPIYRKAQLEVLIKLAKAQDTPMIWVEYREACEQFFAKHNTRVDSNYAEVLKHYANSFCYGALQAFLDKQAGKPYEQRALEKISVIEREMAENDTALQSSINQLLGFVRAQQLDYEIVEEIDFLNNDKNKGSTQKAPLIGEFLIPLTKKLSFLGFDLLFVGRDKRLEKATEHADEKGAFKVIIVVQRDATFATLSASEISTQTLLDKLLNKLCKKRDNHFKIDVTMTTFFNDDIVLKSLNKIDQARHDAPKGYLVKCRNYDLQTQWQLHEEHVDELERRMDSRRLNNLSKTDFLYQEAIYADRLLAYKKAHGFMTFSEYHRATNIESRLSYSLILHGLAERIIEGEGAFCA